MKFKFKFSIPKVTFALPRVGGINIIGALLPRENIGGLEITDTEVRLMFLKEKGGEYAVQAYGTEKLKEGIVVNGMPERIDELAQALRRVFERSKPFMPKSREVIVAVNDRLIFSQPFSVPLTLDEESAVKFVHINLGRVIPFEPPAIYVDWHDVQEVGTQKLIFVASGSRSLIDRYREAFFIAEVTPVALEPASLAVSRTLDLPEGYAILFSFHPGGFAASIFSDGELYFRKITNIAGTQQALSSSSKKGSQEQGEPSVVIEALFQEAGRLKDFVVSELGKKEITFLFISTEEGLTKELEEQGSKFQEIVLKPAAFKPVSGKDFRFAPHMSAAWGAGIRGLIPRREDKIISILPVGTELEYIRKKRKIFISAVKKLTYSVTVACIILLIGLNAFLGVVLQGEVQRLSAKRFLSLPSDLPELERAAQDFNENVVKIADIYSRAPSPVSLLEAIKTLQLPGITFTKVGLKNEANPLVNITGIATTRESLVLLKDHVTGDSRFSDVNIPFQSFGARRNVNFTMSFTYTP